MTVSVKNITPLPGYVLVEPTKAEEKTASGLYVPGASDEKPQYGKVLAVGGAFVREGEKVESPVPVNAQVIYKKWGGNDFKVGDVEYQFLKFEDLLAVIK